MEKRSLDMGLPGYPAGIKQDYSRVPPGRDLTKAGKEEVSILHEHPDLGYGACISHSSPLKNESVL